MTEIAALMQREPMHPGSVAIVGMACRFPDAPDVATFWRNLKAGHEAIRNLRSDEIDDDYDAATRAASSYVKRRPILDGIENFDAAFFGMSPREAALTDPQQRVFLECAWAAFEDAAIDPAAAAGPIGVFAGSAMNTYFLRHVLGNQQRCREFTTSFQVGHYQELLGAMQEFVATRVAYKLDLKGPAVNVQSACSTSLLAVAQACQSLQLYQCDAAIAGGVSISVPQHRGYESLDGGMVSPDGRVRPFDSAANGTVFGSGCGVVVLKRLEDAITDGDRIYAVIRGCGVNNDGGDKIGFTAPSAAGQAEVIRAAHANAGVTADQIGYVEAHGTATPLGDPIEFRALEAVFGTSAETGTCTLGSVKANVGHLDAAAGVTGLIKAALQLHHAEVPPQINFERANAQIDMEHGRFRVTTSGHPWPRSATPRMGGVSAFGVGGTNVHVVIEEAPALVEKSFDAPVAAHDQPIILPLSAKTPDAIRAMAGRLASAFSDPDAPALHDAAQTLMTGRRLLSHRAAIAARDGADAVRQLTLIANSSKQLNAAHDRGAVFMFPGQGSQYPGMATKLYASEPVFAEWIDRGAALAAPQLGRDIRALLFDAVSGDEAMPHALRDTTLAQPALYIVEYALAQLWLSRGVAPIAYIGHSLGEFAAAALAGVFSYDDGLALVVQRGRLMQALPPGGMIAVRASLEAVTLLLSSDIEIAAINAPNLITVAGPNDALVGFEARAESAQFATRRLHTSHAFHSAMMDPAIAELISLVSKVSLSAPKIQIASCVTGTWLTDENATSPVYWARHCRVTVKFAQALQTVAADTSAVLLEVGPGRTLTTFAQQQWRADQARTLIASLPEFADRGDDRLAFAAAMAQLWTNGVPITLPPVKGGRRVSLPTYPFAPTRHWIDLASMPEVSTPPATAPTIASPTMPASSVVPSRIISSEPSMTDHTASLRRTVTTILEELCGEVIDTAAAEQTFLELGFDSLMLGQVAQRIQKATGVKIAFRQLLSDLPTIAAVSDLLAARVPQPPVSVLENSTTASSMRPEIIDDFAPAPSDVARRDPQSLDGLMREQLAAMERVIAQQLQAFGSRAVDRSPITRVAPVTAHAVEKSAPAESIGALLAPVSSDDAIGAERFRMFEQRPRGTANGTALTRAQKALIENLVRRSNAKFAKSKADTQAHRQVQADPRSASGFRAEWKELVYPLLVDRSAGSKLWDADGNEYVDVVNGFGQTMFGHSPSFVTDAVKAQLDIGFAIGPQTPLAGEVAQSLAKMLQHERIAFCNTGSEAVMAAMRVARTVTGRNKIAFFGGDYHGQFDEVLAKGLSRRASKPGAQPAASGIPPEAVANMIVLAYDAPESLAYIREHAEELAAVLVEPVQSRHPSLLPTAFLHELRRITAETGTALIFDEVVTGFRVHQAGVQGLIGIKADLATYGKVLGGGMPIGILAGSAAFLDALDGGQWSFGDTSVPEVAPTFFAGTFVRHPLTLAAAKAVLAHMTAAGPQLQLALTASTAALVARLNAILEQRGIRTRIETFASIFYFNLAAEDPLAGLLYPLMRLDGIHIAESFPCFLTTAHSAADIDRIVAAFDAALQTLQAAGILSPITNSNVTQPIVVASPQADTVQYAPTEAQREIYLAAQFGDAASCAFNESVSVSIAGAVDAARLRASLESVVARHDALRIHFGATGETLTTAPICAIGMALTDLADRSDGDAVFAALLAKDARTPFDLAKGPLLRANLVSFAADRNTLVLTAHHIACDGWSLNVLIAELLEFYRASKASTSPTLLPVLSFSQFAPDLSMPSEDARKTRRFWSSMYRDIPAALELPSDRPRPAQRTWAGATLTDTIPADVAHALKRTAAKNGATLFSALFSCLQILMGRLAASEDVVLTVPMAAQTKLEDQSLVGHCVNFLPIRCAFTSDMSFATHLKAVHGTVLGALSHQDYTLGTLVRDMNLPRSIGRTPLSDVQFNLERLADDLELDGARVSIAPNPKAAVNFDLFFNFIESAQGLRVDVDFNTDLYDAATIRRWIGHFRTLLKAICTDAHQTIARLPMLNADEVKWLMSELNATAKPLAADAKVHALIEAQARRTPDAIAIRAAGRTISYRELDMAANGLAHHLLTVAPGGNGRIAVAVDRSIDMVISLLAVMKSGHAYVPLDPTHPPARLKQTIDAARVSALIATDELAVGWAGRDAPVVPLKTWRTEAAPLPPQDPPNATSADRAAYVIFTSGSTGTPKGVEVGHRSVVNFLQSMAETPGFTSRDHLLAVTTVCFDIAGLELFLPLVTGGSLTIASRDDVQDGFALARLIDGSGATVVQATPSLWQILLEAGFKPHAGLKMLCGGEPLPRDLADILIAGGELWNLYGPTETTIWSSCVRIGAGPIAIGAPIANTRMYVLDAHDQLQPIGVAGDLYIGGEGLAHGYFDRPDLTDAAFRNVEIAGGQPQRLYRTGDVACRHPNGSLQLFGRRDQQIKLRGYRIELEEIEAVVRASPDVAGVAVAMREDGAAGARLVAFVVPKANVAWHPQALAAQVAARLPAYMVPAQWMSLQRLPQTANGKLDRKALATLPMPGRRDSDAASPTVLPTVLPAVANAAAQVATLTSTEETIAAVWREVLGLKSVASDVSIFDHGADSLHIFRIAARLHARGLPVQARDLLAEPTVARQAVLADRALAALAAEASQSGATQNDVPSLSAYRAGAMRNRATVR